MKPRDLFRGVALRLPPMRRLYQRTEKLSRTADRLRAKLAILEAKVPDLEAKVPDADKVAELLDERERLNIQIYTLRSDLQRATSRNEQLHGSLQKATDQIEQLRSSGDDLLLSRFSILSSQLDGIRQLLKGGVQRDPVSALQLRLSYLDLLERALTGYVFGDEPLHADSKGYNAEIRLMGRDWPSFAHTMIGVARIRNIRLLAETILEDDVPGDLLEAGAWRGGACIFMRGILAAHGVTNRAVWVADSFCGWPQPNPDLYPADAGDAHHKISDAAVSVEEVKSNFVKYQLLDDQVIFLPGWFKDTLPGAPVKSLALLRIDGGMYQSTIEPLEALYTKVSRGGYVIIDDYILPASRQAVDDFRKARGILEVIQPIDGAGVYWRKEA
jgi:macrocin-O-methyltransferase TylF-like protien